MTPALTRQIETLAQHWHDPAYWRLHGIDATDLTADLRDVLMQLEPEDAQEVAVAWYAGVRAASKTPSCGPTYHVHPIGAATCVCGQQRTASPTTDAIVTGPNA